MGGVTLSESRAAMTGGLEVYRDAMNAKASAKHLPLDEMALEELHRSSETTALQTYRQRAVGDAAKKFQQQLTDQIADIYTKFRTDNDKASCTACTALLQQLFNEIIQSKLNSEHGYSSSDGSLEQVREDFRSLRARYLEDAKGPQKQSLLVVFIEEKMGDVMRLTIIRVQTT